MHGIKIVIIDTLLGISRYFNEYEILQQKIENIYEEHKNSLPNS